MAAHGDGPGPASDPHALRRSARPTLVLTLLTVVGGLVLYGLAPMRGRRSWLGFLLGLVAVGVIVPLTVRRARSIRASDRPILEAIETLVLLFTLLVLGFATVYVVIAGRSDQIAGLTTKIDGLYFTVGTLATVGFGDVHAVGPAARVIVTLQIVFDLVFIATAVRMLTSVAQRRATEKRGTG